MKRVFFTQQKPFQYASLKAGLGIISEQELHEYTIFYGSEVKEGLLKHYKLKYKSLTDFQYQSGMLLPKLYTTRPHKLNGDYHVVEGSRYDAHPVNPEIALTSVCRGELNLRNRTLNGKPLLYPDQFAQADLGIKNTTFDDLIFIILKLNKKHTIDTPFYINSLFPLGKAADEPKNSVIITGTEEVNVQEELKQINRCRAIEQSRITDWGVI